MKQKPKHSGISLMEMIAVVAAVAILTLITIPAIKGLQGSLVSEGSTKVLIDSTLASARAMAIQNNAYVGVRFQKAYKHNGKDPGSSPNTAFESSDLLGASQYMIFIIQEKDMSSAGNTQDVFRVVEGTKPIKLPDNFTVMDMRIRTNSSNTAGDAPIQANGDIDENKELWDTSTFSVIFSKSGKLVIRQLRCRNKNGKTGISGNYDDVFNIIELVAAVDDNSQYQTNKAMFFEDSYPDEGLGKEFSRRKLLICETDKLNRFFKDSTNADIYDDYLKVLAETNMIYVNPYTGRLIKNKNN